MSCNILLDLPEHKGTALDWAAHRREACEDLIRAQRADVLCLQEVGRTQNDDFARAFPEFTPFGYDDPYVDRRPKRFQSIKNVILFSAERYDLLTGGAYWFSATPWLAGSRFPEEGLPRHVTSALRSAITPSPPPSVRRRSTAPRAPALRGAP